MFGDRRIRRSCRHLKRYGDHTYGRINIDGQMPWVKFHFISTQGIRCCTQLVPGRLVSIDADYHTLALHNTTGRAQYPNWTPS